MSKAVEENKTENITVTVTVTVHRKPACRVELDVHAPLSLVKAARKEAVKRVSKEVVLPGFRKGRAPEDMIVKKYPQAVEKEWHKAIADAAFGAAQMQARVPMLNSNAPVSFDLKSKNLDTGAHLVFTFETEPEIPHVDPKEFVAKEVKKAEVGQAQIDEAVRQMRFFYADWKAVKERGIQEGDYIMIDLETIEGEPQKVFDHIRFEVSQARMAQWMKDLVIGAKAGDVLEGLSEPDADATEEEKKEFVPKKIRLTIHKVEEATLPELTDEFAKKMHSENVEQMVESIRGILQKNADDKARTELREQVNDFLIDRFQFELPLSLIQTEKNHRRIQLENDPKFRQSLETMSEGEKKRLEEKLYTESSQAVRLFYLSRQIVREAKIPVTHHEVEQEAVQSAGAFGRKVDPQNLPKEVFALALSKLILAKAQDYILANAGLQKAPESV